MHVQQSTAVSALHSRFPIQRLGRRCGSVHSLQRQRRQRLQMIRSLHSLFFHFFSSRPSTLSQKSHLFTSILLLTSSAFLTSVEVRTRVFVAGVLDRSSVGPSTYSFKRFFSFPFPRSKLDARDRIGQSDICTTFMSLSSPGGTPPPLVLSGSGEIMSITVVGRQPRRTIIELTGDFFGCGEKTTIRR